MRLRDDRRTEEWVEAAKEGRRDALEHLILRIQDAIYGLALKMLGHPEDAEDASQEILIKIITMLGGFRGESSFETWMYRVACNHLLTTRKRRAERIGFPLEEVEGRGGDVPSDVGRDSEMSSDPADPERKLLGEEVRMRCLQATLLSLNRKERLAFIFGEIFQVSSKEGAQILEITPGAFRKRLSRARNRVKEFMGNCGLIIGSASCQCQELAEDGVRSGWLGRDNLLFAGKSRSLPGTEEMKVFLEQWDEIKRRAELFRSYPEYRAPGAFVSLAKDFLAVGLGNETIH